MNALIKSELYKLKHNHWIWITWLSSMTLGIIFFLTMHTAPIQEQVGFMGDFFPILMCIVVGGIWTTEYTQKTIKDMFSSKYKRITFFYIKLSTTIFVSFITFLIYDFVLLFLNDLSPDFRAFIFNMFLGQGVLVLAQSFFLILVAIIFQSFSKLAMFSLIFLIFSRIANSMSEGMVYFPLTSKTFLPLFYGVIDPFIEPIVFQGIIVFVIFGILSLGLSALIFIKQEVK